MTSHTCKVKPLINHCVHCSPVCRRLREAVMVITDIWRYI